MSRTASQDSTYIIRRNPLNITQLDGSDLILSKHNLSKTDNITDGEPCFDIDKNKHPGISISHFLDSKANELSGAVSVKKPVTVNPDTHLIQELQPKMATSVTVSPQPALTVDSSPTNSSPSEVSSSEFYNDSLFKPMEKIQLPVLDSPELFSSFQQALDDSIVYNTQPVKTNPKDSYLKPSAKVDGSPGLARKNTITSNHDTVCAPSSQQVFQKLNKAYEKAKSPLVPQSKFDDDSHIVEQLKRAPSTMVSKPDKSDEIETLGIPSGEDADSVYGDAEENIHQSEPSSPMLHSSPTLGDLDPVDETDRGRLFLKICGIKDLQLPLDKKRHPKFVLSLDNGLQTVKTYPIDLLKNNAETNLIPIDHEFELVVSNDELHVVLTLFGQMDPLPPVPTPAPRQTSPERRVKIAPVDIKPSVASVATVSPEHNGVTPPSSPKKKKFGLFSRSPKKSKDEVLVSPQPLAPETHKRTPSVSPPPPILRAPVAQPKDVWAGKTGKQGEFTRAYLVESQFENEIYGRPQTYILSGFNEWAKREDKVNPYRICGIQVTMMFVPRFYKSEELPSSTKAALAELKNMAEARNVSLSGFLSQQGGDCRFWRRRWFSLEGKDMVGHHEDTKKVRNTINLSNVSVVDYSNDTGIYDERAFKMEFKDGETISFYADTVQERDEWLKTLNVALAHCTGKTRGWYDLVLQRHEENRRKKSMLSKKYQARQQLSESGNSGFHEDI
ncbi:Bud4p [Sugiyamaella lignohabitans]|uniref:Bud4p n=1 Tax=Sugiyamaella lignohabitans TaxID=796027 RepID=A0A167FEF1_9ASCO|nr:Bud4p [Sugiyamaella lignohabitans]ANB15195.1 Bud4p [Sugiyamaella lignohabitans]